MILNTSPFLYEKPLGSRSHLTFVTCFILTLFFAFCQKISQDLVSSMEISFFEGLRESFPIPSSLFLTNQVRHIYKGFLPYLLVRLFPINLIRSRDSPLLLYFSAFGRNFAPDDKYWPPQVIPCFPFSGRSYLLKKFSCGLQVVFSLHEKFTLLNLQESLAS